MAKDSPPHHIPIEVAKVLMSDPARMTMLAMAIHQRRPYFVLIQSPMNEVKMEGMKNDAA